MATGKIVQIIGAVVDVEFPQGGEAGVLCITPAVLSVL